MGAENRPQGVRFVFRVVKIFPRNNEADEENAARAAAVHVSFFAAYRAVATRDYLPAMIRWHVFRIKEFLYRHGVGKHTKEAAALFRIVLQCLKQLHHLRWRWIQRS